MAVVLEVVLEVDLVVMEGGSVAPPDPPAPLVEELAEHHRADQPAEDDRSIEHLHQGHHGTRLLHHGAMIIAMVTMVIAMITMVVMVINMGIMITMIIAMVTMVIAMITMVIMVINMGIMITMIIAMVTKVFAMPTEVTCLAGILRKLMGA